MRFSNVAIEAMAYSLPPETWTSAQIEDQLAPLYDRLNLPHGRLELMTGIRERRFWPASLRPSEASAEAGNALLANGVDAGKVDLLIHSAVCRDRLEPATASYVHRLMGMGDRKQILDVSNACLGFLNAVVLAGGLIESGQIKRAVIASSASDWLMTWARSASRSCSASMRCSDVDDGARMTDCNSSSRSPSCSGAGVGAASIARHRSSGIMTRTLRN